MWRRVLPLWCWSILIWTVLTWTATVEQVAVGLAAGLVVAMACAPLGSVVGPWALLRPRRTPALLALVAVVAVRVAAANWHLARSIWSRRPIPSGMVVVWTSARSDGELATVGLLTSLIVNSQLVDLDRRRHELQYHLIEVSTQDRRALRDRINGPVEEHTLAVTRR